MRGFTTSVAIGQGIDEAWARLADQETCKDILSGQCGWDRTCPHRPTGKGGFGTGAGFDVLRPNGKALGRWEVRELDPAAKKLSLQASGPMTLLGTYNLYLDFTFFEMNGKTRVESTVHLLYSSRVLEILTLLLPIRTAGRISVGRTLTKALEKGPRPAGGPS